MKCEWYQRWLTASADDELAGWRAALLRRHLSMCADCSVQLAGLRRLRQLVASQKDRYVAGLDDRNFWEQLLPQLQVRPLQHPQPQPGFDPDGELVMAYSSHRPVKEPRPSSENASFGRFPMRGLIWIVAAATVVALVAGFCVIRAMQSNQVALDIPLLPPPGQNRVEFAEITSAKDTWAGVVKLDKPDTDIAVIWVDGLSSQ